MVKLRTRRWGMGRDVANHHEKLGRKRILCASQFVTPDTAGVSPNLACNHTDPRFSQPDQASHTSEFSYSLISSTSFSGSTLISYLLVHNSTIITEYDVKPSLSISPCHKDELTPNTAYTEYSIPQIQHIPNTAYTKYSTHQIQLTPNTAYTKYSIHWIQHTPSTAYTEYSILWVQHTLGTAYSQYSILRVQHTQSTAYSKYSIYLR